MPAQRRRLKPISDVEIGAVAKARKLHFQTKPKTRVTFPGSAPSSGSHSERKNLPDEVEPGVTYRDVEVRWEAHADVKAELLGDERGREDGEQDR